MMAVQELNDPQPVPTPIVEAPWYVMLTEPQQDLTTVWRLHELGLEMFVPVIRKRVKTGRIGKNNHKVTRIIAKPMFPGYGFLRMSERDLDAVRATRGVRDFLRNERNQFVTLPHAAVVAVFKKQMEEQQKWIEETGERRVSSWKRGDKVRIDEGAYSGFVAVVDKIDSKGRIEILLGMIRHKLPADMVVAA
jgi:transcription antitermination factor NusG